MLSQDSVKFLELCPQVRDELAAAMEAAVSEAVSAISEKVKAVLGTNGHVGTRKPAKAKVTATVAKVAKTPTVSKASKTSDTGGKGRKECPACHKFVGARAQTCPACQHAFVIGEKAEKAEKSEASGQGRRAKGESLSDVIVAVLKDAASDGRRKEPSLELGEIIEKLPAKGYRTNATEKNLRVAVQQRLGDLVKKGEILRSEDQEGGRKYTIKSEPAVA